MVPDDLEGCFELYEYLPDLWFWEGAVGVVVDVDIQIGELAVLEDQVEVPAGLLEVHQLDDVLVLYYRQHVHLLMDPLQLLLAQVL
jgi:hypothetical protein